MYPARLAVLSAARVFVCAALCALFSLPACSDSAPPSYMGGGGDTSSKSFIPSEFDIVVNKQDGLRVVKNVINITFKADTDDKTINKIISSIKGQAVGYDRSVNLYQVQIPGADISAINKLRGELLGKYKEIELASLFTVSVHRDPYYAR